MSPLSAALLGLVAGSVLGAVAAVWYRRRPRTGAGAPPAGRTRVPDDRLIAAGRQLSEVAHELANPLTAILAFAEDLLHAEPAVEQREALMVIRHQARRSRLLLRGLLDTVRGEDHPVARIRFDPTVLIERMAAVVARDCEERGLDFFCVRTPDLPSLVGDEAALEQVLANLLRNACQATPRGGQVSLAAQVRGRLLEFVIRDSGPGIAPEVMNHIFEPFYTTKPAGEGTGLGLSISQGIVRKHRGILTAENIPEAEGGGARFVVALPFEDRRWRDRHAAGDETVAGPAPGTNGRHLLLVDDEASIRAALRRFLERGGWVVHEVVDGRAALAALLPEERGLRFDAIVCDLNLPGVSGMVVYGKICAEAPGLRDRVVLMTGDRGLPEVRVFLERTGVDALEKPFEMEILQQRLEAVAPRRAG